MRAFVLGGAGFLGSHLVDRLLAERSSVDVVDDLSGGSLANLAAARNESLGELRIHHLDAGSTAFVDLVAQRAPDVIFNLVEKPGDDRSVVDLVLGVGQNVIAAAVAHKVARVVMTVDAMSLFGAVPPAELPVKDGRPVTPDSRRGIAYRAMIDLLAHARRVEGLESTVLALASVYGDRQRTGVVAAFAAARRSGQIAQVHGDGRQTRDFIYVDDVVDAVTRGATKGGGLVINVGTGVQTPIRVLERLVMGADAPPATRLGASDGSRFSVSPVRARIHLAWAPWTSVTEGVAQLNPQT